MGQGVEFGKLEAAAVFWQSGTVGALTASGPACVLFDGNPGHGLLAVSDPTQTVATISVTLAGTAYRRVTSGNGVSLALDATGNTVVTVSTAGLLGATVEIGLHR